MYFSPSEKQPFPTFVARHNGPRDQDIQAMLNSLGLKTLEDLCQKSIPDEIRIKNPLKIKAFADESAALDKIYEWAAENKQYRSLIGMGYARTKTPAVIQRNILENPSWYTQYTPYQAEISQGRLEVLFNFQTMICDLTGMEIANSSMLDEASSAAEAMSMLKRVNRKSKGNTFLVDQNCHPQILAVLKTRAKAFDIKVLVMPAPKFTFNEDTFGCLIQYPGSDGQVFDPTKIVKNAHDNQALVCMATDLMALTMLEKPSAFDVDLCFGNSQRFGVPLGFGGPHAAFFATKDAYKRQMPGRLIGLSKDAAGHDAYRLTLQTREQHIRREKATSNICTAQVLLAIMAAMYAIYHGPKGLTGIAENIHKKALEFNYFLKKFKLKTLNNLFFDTLTIQIDDVEKYQNIVAALEDKGFNLRLDSHFTHKPTQDFAKTTYQLGISFDEKSTLSESLELISCLCGKTLSKEDYIQEIAAAKLATNIPNELLRTSNLLDFDCFNTYHSETELMRHCYRLQQKDLSLTTSMIPLGSCTMKLNAAAEMMPLSHPGFGNIHPFVPKEQALGYYKLIDSLGEMLKEITGMDGISFQPNAGSQGEYAGLLTIRSYLDSIGQQQRKMCLIPASAHGTNPASAQLAGFEVKMIKNTDAGKIDMNHLRELIDQYKDNIAAMMITYPTTNGIFEDNITEICGLIHGAGGQIYLDGANMNAQVGISRPGDYGADVLHLNLHKTFSIPHGGGGPGMGPIATAKHLTPFLPQNPIDANSANVVASAPFSSASILTISWMYIVMMGGNGLKKASQLAILNANYMRERLESSYEVLFHGPAGFCAHEFIIKCKDFGETGIKVEDIAKRLMDYGFHAPTMSWPVVGSLMIEPTESESLEELDRLCDALIQIKAEIQKIADEEWPKDNNPLVNSPHPASVLISDEWNHPYSRKTACYPAKWQIEHKYWPTTRRIDNVYGDRHVVCSCPAVSDYA